MRRLLIRPGAIGDVILALPALEFLKTDYTEVWVPSAVASLICFADKVRAISATGIDLLGVGDLLPSESLRAALVSFDEVICWYGANRAEFRNALAAVNSRVVFHPALPPTDSQIHATDFFAGQVGAPLGLVSRIPVAKTVLRQAIAIHPFSGSAAKNWPLAQYQEFASKLPLAVEWIAGPEQELAGAQRFDHLRDLADWLSGARLYIGNDSGITHLAAAVGVPVIALFKTTNPRVWAPRGLKVEIADLDTVETAVNRLLCLP